MARFLISARRASSVVAAALLACLSLGAAPRAAAGEVAVAVASNFLQPLREIAPVFEAESGHTLRISAGSTGKLYAQIVQGAPYDVFLAANVRDPERLEAEGEAAAGSRFTYALGRLVFWGAEPGLDPKAMLQTGAYSRLAIANPKLAPYGRAARQALDQLTLDQLGGESAAAPPIILAETVSQALQFARTGNVDLAAFALSQVSAGGLEEDGSLWIAPETLYDPIRQQAVLLNRGEDNPAAVAFYAFLRSDAARAAIIGFGYGVE
ncbi:MAG: molybdate ABC transporter substrate-binding protein [Pseudomonadota bacterium]